MYTPPAQCLIQMRHTVIESSRVAQTVRRLPTMWETQVQSMGREDPLEEAMANHSRTLAWKIPWTEEHCRLQSTGSQRVRHDWATSLSFFLSLSNKVLVLNIIPFSLPPTQKSKISNLVFSSVPYPSALANTYLQLCPFTYMLFCPCDDYSTLHIHDCWSSSALSLLWLLYLLCPSLEVTFNCHFLLLENSWKYFFLSLLLVNIIIYFASN